MIDALITAIYKGVEYIRNHPQLLMTLLLIIVIPIAFLLSGQQFLSAARDNQERLEKDRIGIMHDILASFLAASNFNAEIIQTEIEHIATLNSDITKFRIAKEEGNDIRIIASLDTELINTLARDPNTYRIGNTNPNESIINAYAEKGVRYWQSFRLVRGDEGTDYYIFVETSLEHIDSLFAARVTTAYYWLIGLLCIILILLMRHVRLIDYAYLYQETKKANEMKDLFTNMIAHELRAPLTAMRGYASMIRESEKIDEQARLHATRIENSAERLVLIVSDLLDVARIQSGKLTVTKDTVHISKLINSVTDSLKVSALEKHIDIRCEKMHADIFVIGDEKRLYQAFTNLVSNAIKYTKQGSITISLNERNDRVEIRVQDTGMGISAENQKNIFTPFFRVESSETNSVIGSGLGMLITKQLIELMNGSISVESIKGVGTHVVVTLPKMT